MTGDGRFVEVQGTAEGLAFSRAQLDGLVDLAAAGHRPSSSSLEQQYLAQPLGPWAAR